MIVGSAEELTQQRHLVLSDDVEDGRESHGGEPEQDRLQGEREGQGQQEQEGPQQLGALGLYRYSVYVYHSLQSRYHLASFAVCETPGR